MGRVQNFPNFYLHYIHLNLLFQNYNLYCTIHFVGKFWTRPKSFQNFPNPFRILLKLMNKKILKSENYKKGEKICFYQEKFFLRKMRKTMN